MSWLFLLLNCKKSPFIAILNDHYKILVYKIDLAIYYALTLDRSFVLSASVLLG